MRNRDRTAHLITGLAASSIVFLLLVPASGASTIEQVVVFSPPVENVVSGCGPYPDRFCFYEASYEGDFTIGGFDSSLGELTSVTLTISTIWSGTTDFHLSDSSLPEFTPSYFHFFDARLDGATPAASDATGISDASCNGLMSGQTCTIDWGLRLDATADLDPAATNVVDADSVLVTYGGGYEFNWGDRWSDSDDVETTEVTFTATYVFVPEPGTAALLGAGLVFAATGGRRKASRRARLWR